MEINGDDITMRLGRQPSLQARITESPCNFKPFHQFQPMTSSLKCTLFSDLRAEELIGWEEGGEEGEGREGWADLGCPFDRLYGFI
ncbi:hypothetical protein JZ751_008735 [Albula glossodonta]|uniref:Uncharacterized protein n=1 Tax=Albula glossodonta TaxID=121402 RepID=A0A8T2P2N9_9TELE|nr:hypothetical protein JZ751_008735 [Albula glossodonta]